MKLLANFLLLGHAGVCPQLKLDSVRFTGHFFSSNLDAPHAS
jgi:hypothetical protein